MVGILLAFSLLAFVGSIGILIGLMRTHGYMLSSTFISVLEAIQDIKSYKASKMK